MLARLAVLVFGVIQTLLTIRLVIGFIAVPREFEQYVPLLFDVTDALMAPFRGFSVPDQLAPAVRGLDPAVLVALVGWTVVEFVVLALLRFLAPGRERGRDDA
jgi:uncharacterized protein YggT (Ycf19 family)